MSNQQYIIYNFCAKMQGNGGQSEMAINRLTIRLARSSLCQRGCTILHVVDNFAVTQAYPFIRLGIILKLTFLLVINILVTP